MSYLFFSQTYKDNGQRGPKACLGRIVVKDTGGDMEDWHVGREKRVKRPDQKKEAVLCITALPDTQFVSTSNRIKLKVSC